MTIAELSNTPTLSHLLVLKQNQDAFKNSLQILNYSRQFVIMCKVNDILYEGDNSTCIKQVFT